MRCLENEQRETKKEATMVNQQRLPLALIEFANLSCWLRCLLRRSLSPSLNYLNILIPLTQRVVLLRFSSLISGSIPIYRRRLPSLFFLFLFSVASVSPILENNSSLSAIDD